MDSVASITSTDAIFGVATGFMAAKYLFAASELGVFEALANGPLTLHALSEAVHVAPERLRPLLGAVAALELLVCDGGTYRNTACAQAHLAGTGGEVDLRPLVRFWDQLNYPLWMRLSKVIRSGAPNGSMHQSPASQATYSRGVEACSAPSALMLPHASDYRSATRLLDIGGGTGSWTAALLAAHPHMSGTVFDLPNAADLAREHLRPLIEAGRVQVVAGDFFASDIPRGHDLVLIANIMHALSASRAVDLLARVRAAVESGSRLLLVDFWTDRTGTRPRLAALMAGSFLLTTGEGGAYTEEEGWSWLADTGWTGIDTVELPNAARVLVAVAS